MRTVLLFSLLLIFNIGITLAQATDTTKSDSVKEIYSIPPIDSALISDFIKPPPKKYSLSNSLLFSTLLPGSGQFYCERKTRGVIFLASEGIIGGVALSKRKSWHKKISEYQSLKPEINQYYSSYIKYLHLADRDSTLQYLSLFSESNNSYQLSKYNAYDAKFDYYAFVGWGIGIYLTNILDAASSSHHFYSEERKNPALAAGLSAIPVLGLGQFYNGSYQKAGILWTTEVMLLYMAINKWRLAESANDKVNQINNSLLLTATEQEDFASDWSSKYGDALQKRNTYLWYFVLFYFYGIFDAAVDAHLNDKALKIRLRPNADPIEKSASLNLSLNIKSSRKSWQ